MVLALTATIKDAEEIYEGLALVRLVQVGCPPLFLLQEPLPLIFLFDIDGILLAIVHDRVGEHLLHVFVELYPARILI